ncbi:MAG TPA: hypothetical protein VK968_16535, partial [Roseimicrobium sp.]|nr:hypothetical protein [Roseimicrobium sp.]
MLIATVLLRARRLPDPKEIGWVFGNAEGIILTLDTNEKEWSGSIRIPGNTVAWRFECIPGTDGTFVADVPAWSKSSGSDAGVGMLTGRILTDPGRFEGSWRRSRGQKSVNWILPVIARRQSVEFSRGFMIGRFGHKVDFKARFPVFPGESALAREINRHIRDVVEEESE